MVSRYYPSLFPPLFMLISLSLQVISTVNGSPPRNSSAIASIDPHLYHTGDGLIKEVKELVGRHPERLTMETWKSRNKSYFAEILIVTFNHGGHENPDKYRILLSFGQHGRELITSEVALRLLGILCGEYVLPGVDPTSLNHALEKLVIKIVPMENLNGRKLVEAGDLCERRNGRGVDINRNWSVDWGKKEKDYDPYEENPGSAPFSEPEAQIMRKLSHSFRPHIWANVHSGMEALFMPYDHLNTTPKGIASQVMRSMLQHLNHLHCHDKCMVGSGGGSVGYLAHGTATDYMYDIVKVPMAFTFEIYGDLDASNKDCFRMFNPIDAFTYNQVLHDWCSAFISIFANTPHRIQGIIAGKGTKTGEMEPRNVHMDQDSKWEDRKALVLVDSGEWLDLARQELRTYVKFFAISSALLIFFFCFRMSKGKAESQLRKMSTTGI
ncbi:hypothetical protein AMTRI_Chr09g34250 [Amborella trichopoda]